jgi:hypothetical protein
MILDIEHRWAGDLEVSPTGDLMVVSGATVTKQRIFRRLLTNPGDYIWNSRYGAGLPGFIGGTASHGQIKAVVNSQILLESSVGRLPGPEISVSALGAPGLGTFGVTIQYRTAHESRQDLISIPITG